jgi:hypothetical protein
VCSTERDERGHPRLYRGRFPWIAQRRVPFMFVEGQILVPDLVRGAVQPLRGLEPST